MKNFLGEKIRQYRVENGLTQRQFADRCDLDEFYISRIENGQRTPGRTALVQVANAMQISVDSLLQTESNAAFQNEYARFMQEFEHCSAELSVEDKEYILDTLELLRTRFFKTDWKE